MLVKTVVIDCDPCCLTVPSSSFCLLLSRGMQRIKTATTSCETQRPETTTSFGLNFKFKVRKAEPLLCRTSMQAGNPKRRELSKVDPRRLRSEREAMLNLPMAQLNYCSHGFDADTRVHKTLMAGSLQRLHIK